MFFLFCKGAWKLCKYRVEENGRCIHFIGRHYKRGQCNKQCEYNSSNIKRLMEEDSYIDYRKC